MNLDKKLAEWQAAGLLDAEAAERIRAHESRAARPLVLYAVGGLGAVTVGIGIISVVAANWDGIGYPVKLGVDLLLAVALAAGVALSEARRAAFLRLPVPDSRRRAGAGAGKPAGLFRSADL